MIISPHSAVDVLFFKERKKEGELLAIGFFKVPSLSLFSFFSHSTVGPRTYGAYYCLRPTYQLIHMRSGAHVLLVASARSSSFSSFSCRPVTVCLVENHTDSSPLSAPIHQIRRTTRRSSPSPSLSLSFFFLIVRVSRTNERTNERTNDSQMRFAWQ